MLYFFHENVAAVVSHGITKARRGDAKEIDRALAAKVRFARDPDGHKHQE
jgi:hypothetical protein